MNPPLRFSTTEDWTECQLKDICEINPSAEKMPDTFQYIDLESVTNGRLLQTIPCCKSSAPSRARRILSNEDVLFQTVRPYQKNNYFFKSDSNTSVVASTGYAQLRCSSNSAYFLYTLIHTDSFVNQVLQKCTGGAYPAITASSLSTVKINIPVVQEQQKIASFFTTLDQKIELNERKLEALEELKKGLMQKIFNREIRFKSKEGKDYPCWKIAKLSEISQSLSYGLNASAAQFDGKNGYLRITDIDERTNKYISSARVSPSCNPDKKYLLKEGDIVFARTGNSVGKTYIYKNTDGVLYYAGFLIRARLNPDVYPYFIFLQTLTNKYRKWVRIMSQRSGQPGINSEEYGNYKIVLPCLEEQEKIASVFRELDKKIDLSLAKIASLKKLKQGFMQQMFV